MTNYFLGLTQRTLGLSETLHPSIASMFEPGMMLADDYDWQEQPESEAISEFPPVHQKRDRSSSVAQLPAEVSKTNSQFFFRSSHPRISQVSSDISPVEQADEVPLFHPANAVAPERLHQFQKGGVRSLFPPLRTVLAWESRGGSSVVGEGHRHGKNFQKEPSPLPRGTTKWASLAPSHVVGKFSSSQLDIASGTSDRNYNPWTVKLGLAERSPLQELTANSELSFQSEINSVSPDSQRQIGWNRNEEFDRRPQTQTRIPFVQLAPDNEQFQGLNFIDQAEFLLNESHTKIATNQKDALEGNLSTLEELQDDRTSTSILTPSEIIEPNSTQAWAARKLDVPVNKVGNESITKSRILTTQPSFTITQLLPENRSSRLQRPQFIYQSQNSRKPLTAVDLSEMNFAVSNTDNIFQIPRTFSQQQAFSDLQPSGVTVGDSAPLVNAGLPLVPSVTNPPIQRFADDGQLPNSESIEPQSSVLPSQQHVSGSNFLGHSLEMLRSQQKPVLNREFSLIEQGLMELKTSDSSFEINSVDLGQPWMDYDRHEAVSNNVLTIDTELAVPNSAEAVPESILLNTRFTRRAVERFTPLVQLRSASYVDAIEPLHNYAPPINSPTFLQRFTSSDAILENPMDEPSRDLSLLASSISQNSNQQAIRSSIINASSPHPQAREQTIELSLGSPEFDSERIDAGNPMIQNFSNLKNSQFKATNHSRTDNSYLSRSIEKEGKTTISNKAEIQSTTQLSSPVTLVPSSREAHLVSSPNQRDEIIVAPRQSITNLPTPNNRTSPSNNQLQQFHDRIPTSFEKDITAVSQLQLIPQQLVAPQEQVIHQSIESSTSNQSTTLDRISEPKPLPTNRLQAISEVAQSQQQPLVISETQFSERLDDRIFSDPNPDQDALVLNHLQNIKPLEVRLNSSSSEDIETDSHTSRSTINRSPSNPVQPPSPPPPRTIVYLRPSLRLDDYLKRRKGGRS